MAWRAGDPQFNSRTLALDSDLHCSPNELPVDTSCADWTVSRNQAGFALARARGARKNNDAIVAVDSVHLGTEDVTANTPSKARSTSMLNATGAQMGRVYFSALVRGSIWQLVDFGAVAQLGERRVRNAKVGSSILLRSTNRHQLLTQDVRVASVAVRAWMLRGGGLT